MAEEKKEGFGIFAALKPLEGVLEIVQLIMLAVGFKEVHEAKTDKEKRQAVIQHLPKLFGFGKSDEAIFGSLRTSLKKEYRAALDKIMQKLPIEEAIAFILTVAMMPNDITTSKKGDEETIAEFSEDDRRVIFLKNLVEDANMCATDPDVDSAIAVLRANRLTAESNLSKLQKEVKRIIVELLKLEDVDDLGDLDKVAEAINKNLLPEIKACRKKAYKPGLIGWLFQI